MNAQEISQALQDHPVTRDIFCGVFSADQIPVQLDKMPGACVVNTDPSDKPGKHWTAMYQDGPDVVEFFDSYGKNPSFYKLNLPFSEQLVKQDQELQSNLTTVCGQYCMYFIFNRCSGTSFTSLVKKFSSDTLANDRMVLRHVNSNFKLKTPIIDVDFLLS